MVVARTRRVDHELVEVIVDQEYSPLTVGDERSLVRTVAVGIVIGTVLWAALGVLVARLGAPDSTWTFAFGAGGFAGFWGGLFFGSAAAVALHGHRAEKAEAAARHGAQPHVTNVVSGTVASVSPTRLADIG